MHCQICGCALDDYELSLNMSICTFCDELDEMWDDGEQDDD